MTRIAHGEVEVTVDDRGAIARLEEIRAAWKSTMSSIDRDEAKARIDADIKPLEEAVARARREVRRLKGEKAEVEMGVKAGDEEALAGEIKKAEAEVRRLDGKKAVVEIETRGAAKAIAEQEAVAKAEDRRRRAAAQSAKIDRDQVALNDKLAYAMAGRRSEIAKLQQAYKKQSDELERLSKKHPIGREARVEVEIKSERAIGEMERLKFLLNRLGKHPPVEIEPKVQRRGFDRIKGAFGDMFAFIGNKAAGLSDLTLRLGPFTTSIRQLGVALAFLGPLLVSVGGAATALAGVLTTGIAGAASVASGVVAGLGLNFAGMLYTLRPMAQDFKIAMTATNAYTKAVDKFGKNSTQAQKAHDQMVSSMKAIDPNARRAIVTLSKLRDEWTKQVGPTAKRDVGSMIKDGALAIKAIMPAAAQNTKRSFDLMRNSVAAWSRGIRSAEGVNIFRSLGASANKFLAPALDAIGHLAAGLGRVAESGARLFAGRAGNALNAWAQNFDNATQNGDKLDATITRLGHHAADVIHFFTALGRLLLTVLNGGADAGDNLVKTMTNAMNRWSDFLQTSKGHHEMLDFFDEAIAGTKALFSAFAPLIASFVKWASYLAPAATAFLKGATFVSNFVAEITKLIGLGGSVSAFVSTLGALWAVGKIGAFVSMLARAVGLVRELGALGTLKALATGSFFGQLKGGAMTAGAGEAASELEAGGAAAGAEMRAGAAAAAAELEAGAGAGAVETGLGGAAAGAEGAAFGRVASSGAKAAGVMAGLRGAVGAVGSALAEVSIAGAAAATGVGLLAGAAIYLAVSGEKAAAAEQAQADAFLKNIKTGDQLRHAYNTIRDAVDQTGTAYAQSRLDLRTTKKALDSTRKGTDEHRQALLNYRAALGQNLKNQQDFTKYTNGMREAAQREVDVRKEAYDQYVKQGGPQTLNAQKRKLAADRAAGASAKQLKADQDAVAGAQERYNTVVPAYIAAQNRLAATAANTARAYHGMTVLTGQAEQAIGKLARTAGGAQLSKKISLKFEDPGQVQRVANSARSTLKSGVPSKVVTKIVADSKNAEDAIRRLNHARITTKKLDIIEHGGQAALRMVEQIIGRKLTPKEQRLVQKGGPAVLDWLEKIIGKKLPGKTQRINQVGASAVQHAISAIVGHKIPDKNFTIKARDAASAAIGAVRSQLNALHDKTVTATVRTITTKTPKSGRAAGRRPGQNEMSFVGEGSNWRGAKEYIANSKTGAVTTVDQPTLMKLGPNDAVIPTEQRHRDRGRSIFKEMARELGIAGFARGKPHKNVSATSGQIAVAHGQARHNIKTNVKPAKYNNEDIMRGVSAAQRDEQNFRDYATRQAGIIEGQEPSTFLKQVGTNSTGDPIYAEDQGAIDSWAAKLKGLGELFDQLVVKVNATLAAVTQALQRLGDPYHEAGSPFDSIVGTAHANIVALNKLLARENHTVKYSKSKRAVGEAKERIRVYNEELGNQRQIISDSKSDWDSLDSERNDIGKIGERGRLAEAQDSADTYRTDAAAVQGKADTELAQATPKDQVADPFASSTNALSGLEAEQALAQIGQGIAGATPRTSDQINSDILRTNQGIIDQANAMLRDSDTSNDQAAYSAIQQAAQAIAGLGGGAGTASFAAGQMMAYSSARSDLYKNFGSNFALASGFGMTGGLFGGGGYAYGTNPAAYGSGGGSINNVFNQNFQQMPDPHTWSQSVAFELQAAM